MCGILGIVAPAGQAPAIEERQLIAMRETMRARGPDAAGMAVRDNVAFAHRRLSIRDLSAGAQPWWSDDRQSVLVYNGELYNDRELRQQLQQRGRRFRTHCDTETVLAAYEAWGPACVEKFRGMFAFGIYDFRQQSLFLARDRFGIKPLFLTEAGGELIFASTIAALLKHPAVSAEPNLPAVSHYLSTFRLTLGRETVYRGIWQLLPAEKLILQKGNVRIESYWRPPVRSHAHDPREEDAVSELKDRLDDAVRARLVSDVPLGLFISGGVDSNLIARLTRNATSAAIPAACARSITSHQSESDDWNYAALCARACGLDLRSVDVSAREYLATWDQLVVDYRTPVSTPTDVLLYRLSCEMKPRAGVVLGGEGADELFCGYESVVWSGTEFDLLHALPAEAGSPSAALERLQASLRRTYGQCDFKSRVAHYLTANCLIPLALKPVLFQPSAWRAAERDQRMIAEYARLLDNASGDSTAERYAQLLQTVNLESLLSRLDSSTMLASVEARVPFTDHLLVESIGRLPLSYKIGLDPGAPEAALSAAELHAGGWLRSKRLLRSLANRLLPAELARRPKASFPTAVEHWISNDWAREIERRLTGSCFAREVFRPEAIDELSRNLPLAGMRLWPLLNVLAWGDREWGTGGATSHVPAPHLFSDSNRIHSESGDDAASATNYTPRGDN